jgi:hypothetical protein
MNQQHAYGQQHGQFAGAGSPSQYGGASGGQYGYNAGQGGATSGYGGYGGGGYGGSGAGGQQGWSQQGGYGGEQQGMQRSGVSFNPHTMDKDYNLVSVLYHALQAVDVCAKYCEDARREGSQEVAAFMEHVQQQNLQISQHAKQLLFRQRQI